MSMCLKCSARPEANSETCRAHRSDPHAAWPTVGFAEWCAAQGRGVCRRCEDGEHSSCLDMTEEHNECDCATNGHRP